MASTRALKRAARIGLRSSAVRAAALRLAAARGRDLVLVYHRITSGGPVGGGVVPAVPEPIFRSHIEWLSRCGRVVPLDTLVGDHASDDRPRFAITLDDDYAEHHERALPALKEMRATATFFLCARSLQGMGAPWFAVLDALVGRLGIEETSRMIGAPASSAESLAAACEANDSLKRAVLHHANELEAEPRSLSEEHIRAIAAAGMGIGFHTLGHRILPLVDAESLRSELTDGRETLERAVGRDVSLFAYPHGKADARTARAVRAAGYAAAVTGHPGPTTARSDRFLLNRWEPGPLAPDDFVAVLVARLHRSDRT
jgi:peptidoglycan/xylan/chitin deacetylase (PgdA/CDA1 family)